MAYWNEKSASASNLRLFEPLHGWRAHDDTIDAEGRISAQGAVRHIELALHTALNASNLVVLTGAGSSFCAKTPGGIDAPSMPGLWDAVEAAVTPARLGRVISLIPAATDLDKNIEKLLTPASYTARCSTMPMPPKSRRS